MPWSGEAYAPRVFESFRLVKPKEKKHDHRHCRTVSELKGGEGLIVDVDANNLGSVARTTAGERIDEAENRDGRDSRDQHVKEYVRHYQRKRDGPEDLAR